MGRQIRQGTPQASESPRKRRKSESYARYACPANIYQPPACGELGGQHFNCERMNPTFEFGVERLHDGAMLSDPRGDLMKRLGLWDAEDGVAVPSVMVVDRSGGKG